MHPSAIHDAAIAITVHSSYACSPAITCLLQTMHNSTGVRRCTCRERPSLPPIALWYPPPGRPAHSAVSGCMLGIRHEITAQGHLQARCNLSYGSSCAHTCTPALPPHPSRVSRPSWPREGLPTACAQPAPSYAHCSWEVLPPWACTMGHSPLGSLPGACDGGVGLWCLRGEGATRGSRFGHDMGPSQNHQALN